MQRRLAIGVLGILFCLQPRLAWAQHVTATSPAVSASNGFYESVGMSWGFNLKGVSVNFGNGTPVQPAFGGYQPNAGGQFGFATGGNGFNGYLYGWAGQGTSSSLGSVSPSVTVMDGGQGMISDTSQSPFVISVVPVVGGGPAVGGFPSVMALNFAPPVASAVQLPTFSSFAAGSTVNVPDGGGAFLGGVNQAALGNRQAGAFTVPGNRASGASRSVNQAGVKATVHDFAAMDEKLLTGMGTSGSGAAPQVADSSSAAQAAPSVAEARRQHAAEQAAAQDEAEEYFTRGQQAEDDGKPGTAKIYYKMAIRRASGDLKTRITARLDELQGGRK